MPQWLPLQKDDVLPLFIQQRPSNANLFIRLIRKWNSLHRLNRTFFIALATLFIFGLTLFQMISLPSQVEQIRENSSNVRCPSL